MSKLLIRYSSFYDKMECHATIVLLVGLAAYANAAVLDPYTISKLEATRPDGSQLGNMVYVGEKIKLKCTVYVEKVTHYKFYRGNTLIHEQVPHTYSIGGTDSYSFTYTAVIADIGTNHFTCEAYSNSIRSRRSNVKSVTIGLRQVEPDSINISEITSTSAKVTWEESHRDVSYTVSIKPSTAGAEVDPNPVPAGTTTTTLKNLAPGTMYRIMIHTVVGSFVSLPSTKSFPTSARIPRDEQLETLSIAGLAVAVTCLVIIIILIVLIAILFRADRKATKSGGTGNDTHIPMSNLGFERDHQPRKIPTPVVGKSSEFKTWLLSKQVSEDTYEVIQREGFHDPAIFAFLKPEAVSRLAIRPMAQELILTDIVESFNKGETPFQTSGTAGDELYDDVANEKYEHLRVA